MPADPAFADHFRRALEECDVRTVRRIWTHVAPGMPQPASDAEALTAIHYARTQTISLELRHRAWSHRWLLDHGFPSGLPDELRPKAERLYPGTAHGVGISVNVRSRASLPLGNAVQKAMEDAVSEAYADRRTDPVFVKARMMAARDKVFRQ
jgi:hypothetical protein